MSDAESIVGFIRDIAIIIFGVIGIISFVVITVLIAKVTKRVHQAVDRVNAALSKVERVLDIGNVIRDAMSGMASQSNNGSGNRSGAFGLFGAALGFALRQMFRRARRSSRETN